MYMRCTFSAPLLWVLVQTVFVDTNRFFLKQNRVGFVLNLSPYFTLLRNGLAGGVAGARARLYSR
jgi:hypothetical protein